ncbi:fibronectin type III domain-containing protein [Candidatus Poriferisocius sp.]|uniref:fibronectin type III domain-containing protein n=1 Tax=Candidatus Poriferisocius sp. TaxID=3101276 RepID=UPI003B02A4D9
MAPANLRAVAGNSEVGLHWTALTATPGREQGFSVITSYEYRQKTGDGDYSPWTIIIGSGATTGTSVGTDGTLGTADDVPGHTVRGLTNGITYQFEIRARNANGAGAAAETDPVTIASVPGRPRSLTATPGNKSVTLEWTPSSDGGSPIVSWQFRLQSSADDTPITGDFPAATAWVNIPDSNADTTSYTVLSLDNAMIYRFQVRAVNARGVGGVAQSAVVNPGMPPGAPTVLADSATANSVTLTWMPPLTGGALNDGGSPILRYEYSQKAGDGDYGEWTAIAANALFPTTGATLTATSSAGDRVLNTATPVDLSDTTDDVAGMGTTIRGLTAGTSYLFRVRAVNASGGGQPAVLARPVNPGTKPPAPARLSATAVYDAPSGNAQIMLSWTSGGDGGSPITMWQYVTATSLSDLATAAAGADTWVTICDNSRGAAPDCATTTSVSVPRAPTAAGTLPDGDLSFVDRTTATDPALSTDEHHFIIRAVNARGSGFQSGTDSARFSPTVPSAPAVVHIDSTTATTIVLSWPPSVDGGAKITGGTTLRYEYSVKVGDGSYGGWVTGAAPATATATYTVPTGTPPGTLHTFRVRALNARGAGAATESASVAAGAPGTPGADDLATTATIGRAYNAPALVAVPGVTRATLHLVGTTGTTTAATRWEYSYKVGDGDYGNWTFNTNATNFNGSAGTGTLTEGLVIDGLENGMAHTFRIRALNGPLSSPILESAPVTPGVAPPAPQGLTAAAGDKSVTLTWTSAGSGGPPILEWEYCISGHTAPDAPTTPVAPADANTCAIGDADDAGGWTDVPRSNADTTEHTVKLTAVADPTSVLTNGNTYTFRVRSRNIIGGGDPAQSNPATPGKAPSVPARVLAVAGDGRVTITVDAPLNIPGDPGRTVTGYQVRKRQGDGPYDAWESLGTSAPQPLSAHRGVAVTGLVNGATYTFQVRAVNGFGPGFATTSNPATPRGAPTANMLGADPGDGQVVLSWAPGTSGGSAITKWQYRQSESGEGYGPWTDIADSGPETSSHTVTGLSNGISYTFEVRAVNRQGNAVPITSAATMPSAVPPAPTVSAERGNGQVDLSWTAGTSGDVGEDDYAAPTTGWHVRHKAGDGEYGAWTPIADSGPDTTSHSVTGLDNGTAYTFEVRAVNALGSGEAGEAGPETPATTPSAPDLSAERGDGEVTLSWTAGDHGGSAVTVWHLQVNDGEWMPIEGSGADTDSHTVSSLDNGTPYTFSVRAVNDVGNGAAGTASATPATTPSAPEVTATAGDGMVTLSWTAGDHGGSPVTAWHLQVSGGDWTDLSTFGVGPDATGVPVPGLTNGTTYTFAVRAANDVGNGAAGEATATPATTPAAPTVTATGAAGQITVSWTAGDDGGSAVTAWHYRMKFGSGDYGEWNEADASASSVTLTGLDTGTGVLTYTFHVRAVNAIGEGEAGESNDAMPAMASPENGTFYSGVITGADFCTDYSLGGAHLIAHDSDGDGVADVCSLPFTRREAIARQSAVEALAVQHSDAYAALVNAACDMVEGDDDCGGEMLADPPAIPINDGGAFYSGIVTGPSFCANRSLGGPATYPHDGDGDGVADVCALPYTRREAVARQIAGDTLAAMNPAAFRRELASACRGLTGGDYGDDAEDLAADACA